MKLCKDCRWIMPPINVNSACGHPEALWREQSPVTGRTVEHQWGCDIFRMPRHPKLNSCGPDGKLWEPRDNEPQAAPVTGFQ